MKRWIFFIIAIILLGLSIFLYYPFFDFSDYKQSLIFIFFLISIVLLFSSLYSALHFKTNKKISTLQNRLSMWTKLSYHVNLVGDEIFNELPIGIVALDDTYIVRWTNNYAKQIFSNNIIEESIESLHNELANHILENHLNFIIKIGKETYEVIYRNEYKFFYLFNVTDKENIKDKYQARIPALAIIYLDNLDESLAQLDVSEQSAFKGEYLAAIADWANRYDGHLKPYSDERLLLVVYREQLEQMIQDKFDILDKIKQISTQNKLRVTISMGIASWDVNYEDLGIYTQNAVELAVKRGGDQVVVNIQDQKIAYFGAKENAAQKSSKVNVRINAQTMQDLISRSENIYIMGHINADLDVLASQIAVYHLAKAIKRKAYIVIDYVRLDETTKKVHDILIKKIPKYNDVIVTSDVAIRDIKHESLLVVVDSQSPKIVMSKELLATANKIVVVDHHRIGDESFNAMYSIVEPYASSTIELLIDLFDFYNPQEEIELTPLEASIMYGGIVVDTLNFAFRTSSRTFEIASYLKEKGADNTEVKMWLRRDIIRTLEINKLLESVEIYMNRFAIISTQEIYEDRVLLAQVADEALLIDGMSAAFVVAKISENRIGVSARSYQDMNVQVIMESLGGGGHLNSAAAQISDSTVENVKEEIKKFISLEYGGGEAMKVILLEDVRGRGQKDDVIEVAGGFGQYLISQKKAIIANDENLTKLEQKKTSEQEALQKHLQIMRTLKKEIDGKKITIGIQLGQDEKMFGTVTTKQIVEQFEKEHGVILDRKKLELSSDINSVGIYTATITLHKEIKAQFEVHIVEKKNE